MSSCTRCHRPAWLPERAQRDDGRVVEHEPGQLAGGVERRDQLGLGRLEQVGAHALLAAGHHDDPVRRVPVDHDRLLAAHDPLGRLAARPRPHGLQGLAVALLPQRHGAAAARRTPGRPAARVAPSARAARVAATADEKNGPGSGMRPICSSTTHISSRPTPLPPYSSGTRRPVHPSSTSVDHSAGVMPVGLVGQLAHHGRARTRARARRGPPPAVRAARRRT